MKPAHRHNANTEYNKDGLTDCGGWGWEGKGRWEEGGDGGGEGRGRRRGKREEEGGRGWGPYRESVGNGESRRETNSRQNMHTSKRFLEQYYDLVGITPLEFLQCGTAIAENNVPSVENPELKNVLYLQ